MTLHENAVNNSIVVRFFERLAFLWSQSATFRALVALDSLLILSARHSMVAGILGLDLRDEAAWDNSLPGKLLLFFWRLLSNTASSAADLAERAVRGSAIVHLVDRLIHGSHRAFGDSTFVNFVKGVLGISHLGAPSVGGGLLAAYTFLLPFLPTSVNLALAVGLFACFLWLSLVRREFKVHFHRAYLPASLLFLAAFTTTVSSSTIRGSLPSLALWVSYAMLFFVSSQWVNRQSDLLWIAIAWVVSASFVSLLGFRQFLLGVETAESWVDQRVAEDIRTRVHSVFDNPNMLAEYLTYAIALCGAMFLAARSYLEKFGYVACAAVSALCLTITFSRGGWVATAFALFVIGLLKDRRFVALMLVALLLSPAFLPETLLNRASTLVTLDDSSAMYRLTIWKAVLRMISDKWITGVGLGPTAFSKVYPEYEIAGTPAAHSHNLYLQIVAEMGILALVLFMWTMYNHIRDLASADSRALSGRAGFIAIALLAGTLGQLLHGLIDNVWYSPKNVMFFWIAVGLVAGSRLLSPLPEAERKSA